MMSRTRWVRAAALTAAIAVVTAAFPIDAALAEQVIELEQARAGEDGKSGAGATSGNASTGNSGRDRNGNGGNASADDGDEALTSGNAESGEASLPENAEVLEALGVLDEVTIYGVDVLTGLDIPVELLPPPPVEEAPVAPADVDTGGQGGTGETSTISTEPGSGAAPAGGSTNSAAEDGTGSVSNGEKKRDRKNADDTAEAGATDGSTDTATATG